MHSNKGIIFQFECKIWPQLQIIFLSVIMIIIFWFLLGYWHLRVYIAHLFNIYMYTIITCSIYKFRHVFVHVQYHCKKVWVSDLVGITVYNNAPEEEGRKKREERLRNLVLNSIGWSTKYAIEYIASNAESISTQHGMMRSPKSALLSQKSQLDSS